MITLSRFLIPAICAALAALNAPVARAQNCERPEIYFKAQISGVRASARGEAQLSVNYRNDISGREIITDITRNNLGRFLIEERLQCAGSGFILEGSWRSLEKDVTLYLPIAALRFEDIGRGRLQDFTFVNRGRAFSESVHSVAQPLARNGRTQEALGVIERVSGSGLALEEAEWAEIYNFLADNRRRLVYRGGETAERALSLARRIHDDHAGDAVFSQLYLAFLVKLLQDGMTGLEVFSGALGDYARDEALRVINRNPRNAWPHAPLSLDGYERSRNYMGCVAIAHRLLRAVLALETPRETLEAWTEGFETLTKALAAGARCAHKEFVSLAPDAESAGALGEEFRLFMKSTPDLRDFTRDYLAILALFPENYPENGGSVSRYLHKYARIFSSLERSEDEQP